MSELIEIFFGIIGFVVLFIILVAVISYKGFLMTKEKAKEQFKQLHLTKLFNKKRGENKNEKKKI